MAYPVASDPMVSQFILSLDEEPSAGRAQGCLRSRAWCAIPMVTLLTALGFGTALLVSGEPEETGKMAGVATVSCIGIGVLAVLGRSVFAKRHEARGAGCREWKTGFCAYMEPEGVGINSLLAAIPPLFCLVAYCKMRQERRIQETSGDFVRV